MKGRGHDLDDEKFTKGERSGTSFEIKWGGGETGEYFDGRVQALTFEKWKVSPQCPWVAWALTGSSVCPRLKVPGFRLLGIDPPAQ